MWAQIKWGAVWAFLCICISGGWAAPIVYVNANTGNDTTGDGSAVNPYATIQQGIDMVGTGGTVNVADGVYAANAATGVAASITKSLSLVGQSRDGTVIDGSIGGVGASGSYWAKGIHVSTANNVTVENFTVTGFTGDGATTGAYGVLFRDYAHDDTAEGLVSYSNNTVQNVQVTDTYSGIYALVNEYLTVQECLVQDVISDGVFVARASHNAVIKDNTVENAGDQGIWFGQDWAGVAVSNNGLIEGNTVNGAREAGIALSASDNSTVKNNTITNADGGGWSLGALSIMDGSDYAVVLSNWITGNSGAGVGVGTPDSGTTIIDLLIGGSEGLYNQISGNGGGVLFHNATVTDLNMTWNNLYGNTSYQLDATSGAAVSGDARYVWWGETGDPVANSLAFVDGDDNILFSPSLSAPIPEPATWALFGVGLTVCAWRKRRRGNSF